MPFYEYQCSNCGHEEEILQKISDKPLKKCPKCGKLTMKKKVSAAAFRLKGGGWYETDFKSGNKKNVASDAKSDKKSDNKKETKSPDKARTTSAGKTSSDSTSSKKVKS